MNGNENRTNQNLLNASNKNLTLHLKERGKEKKLNTNLAEIEKL